MSNGVPSETARLPGRTGSRFWRTLPCLLLLAFAQATTYRVLSLEEVLTFAELGFQATVSSVAVELRDALPWTVVEFEVERWLVGDTDGERIVSLAFLGGDLTGSSGLQVHLMPTFEVGERVVLLAYDEEYFSPVVGFNQGLWRLSEGELVDPQGRRLGLGEDGRLLRDGAETDPALVLDAVARELEARR